MKITDVPTEALVVSFLKAMAINGVEATVVYMEGTGTKMASNKGGEGIVRAKAALLVKDGGISQAAKELHASRAVNPVTNEVMPEANFCVLCRSNEPWEKLTDDEKEGHRVLVKIAISAALVYEAPPSIIARV